MLVTTCHVATRERFRHYLHCSECRTTPLMREPTAIAERDNRERIQFCALCDGRPEGRVAAPILRPVAEPTPSSATQSQTIKTPESHAYPKEAASEPDPSESISNLLLKGYSLLGENCPNPSCRGIPLVGYPRKVDGSKDGRKMCVSCEGRWVEESSVPVDWVRDAPITSTTEAAPSSESVQAGESPRSRKRRELYGITTSGINQLVSKGKEKAVDVGEFETKARESESKLVNRAAPENFAHEASDELEQTAIGARKTFSTRPTPGILPVPINRPTPPSPDSALFAALSTASDSLSETLTRLSKSLHATTSSLGKRSSSSQDEGNCFVDIKLHTEAMKDVLGVLAQVERAKRQGY
ncbi:hypothetical protein I307_02361 [Cryptococcus deuterogattii 99/473]|uniref:Uncharacterized protein n=1 Tax=Cryptococcus deuterogattii Ram5 TaxID=1296110 RepID=A0A0D0TRX8_9TREE|nr:hypothetical protein I313_05881 [Cryptococcus deuterogattii Ram5]KIY58114.1 hypothetical protein I307_02361 [Cryptococcus deuterogattii 99/473]